MSTNQMQMIPEDRLVVWNGTNSSECIQLIHELSVK